jgi:hypothetical protein
MNLAEAPEIPRILNIEHDESSVCLFDTSPSALEGWGVKERGNSV